MIGKTVRVEDGNGSTWQGRVEKVEILNDDTALVLVSRLVERNRSTERDLHLVHFQHVTIL